MIMNEMILESPQAYTWLQFNTIAFSLLSFVPRLSCLAKVLTLVDFDRTIISTRKEAVVKTNVSPRRIVCLNHCLFA